MLFIWNKFTDFPYYNISSPTVLTNAAIAFKIAFHYNHD